jgi:alpha-L-arabinofuranosidase
MKFLSNLAAAFFLLALALSSTKGWCQDSAITVDLSHPGAKISPSLYGIFFEEINHAGEGGLYAELIRNRSFGEKTEGWTLKSTGSAHASMALDTANPLNDANKTSLRLDIARAAKNAPVALVNDGFWGIAVKAGEKYNLSFFARATGSTSPLEVRLEGPDGKIYARQTIAGIGPEWTRFTASFQSNGTEPKAHLALVASRPGTLWLQTVSLFPANTFKGRTNGMRSDIASMLAGLHPAFLRFPGGCYVEGGNYLRNAFRWKDTVSGIADRPGHLNDMWSYWSSDGLGYHEFLQLSEDLGAEPLFDVNVGMSHKEVEPMDHMDMWVQDALDAIEYANGPVTSKWGALRAKNGHPAPFNLKYMEIGNENAGPNYEARYPLFYKAIKEKYPYMILIANTLVKSPMDIVDNHIYATPEQLRDAVNTYDTWDRASKPKVFVGEYANNNGVGFGSLKGALSEASYMMGFERNADVVVMASYAPLLYNVNNHKWPVNLIGYDSAHAFGSPSYWVQSLFASNRGDVVLPLNLHTEKETINTADRGGITIGTRNSQAEFKDIKVSNGSQVLYSSNFAKGASEWHTYNGDWQTVDGVYKQTSSDWFNIASVGSQDWRDYSLSLKFRKIDVSFHSAPNQIFGGDMRLVLGGFRGALASMFLRTEDGKRSMQRAPGTLQVGQWYDVRIDVAGAHAQIFIDGKPVIDVPNYYRPVTLSNLDATASLVQSSGDVILKVVNFTEQPQTAKIQLDGVASVLPEGSETVLTSASVDDGNSIEQPLKVAPVTHSVSGLAPQFSRTFAPRSLTILRLKTSNAGTPSSVAASPHQPPQPSGN